MRLSVIALLLFALAACAPVGAPPPQAVPEGVGIFTPDDLRARVDSTPDSHKIVLSDEIVVWYPDLRNSMAEWIGAAFIYHIPSMSSVVLTREGRADFGFTHYETEVAQEQLEAILADEAIMERIQQRLAELNEGL